MGPNNAFSQASTQSVLSMHHSSQCFFFCEGEERIIENLGEHFLWNTVSSQERKFFEHEFAHKIKGECMMKFFGNRSRLQSAWFISLFCLVCSTGEAMLRRSLRVLAPAGALVWGGKQIQSYYTERRAERETLRRLNMHRLMRLHQARKLVGTLERFECYKQDESCIVYEDYEQYVHLNYLPPFCFFSWTASECIMCVTENPRNMPTPLMRAAYEGHYGMVAQLLQEGYDPTTSIQSWCGQAINAYRFAQEGQKSRCEEGSQLPRALFDEHELVLNLLGGYADDLNGHT